MPVEHIVIVGLGSIGKRHLELLKMLKPSIKVSIVTSKKTLPAEVESLIEGVSSDLESLINVKPHGAIICSPATAHLRQAEAFLNAGIPVLIEKPLADCADGLLPFIRKSEEMRHRATVGYVLRYRPDLIFFRNFVHSTDIGEIEKVEVLCSSYLPDWRPGRDYKDSVSARKDLGGGVLLELSHELDYVTWIFGKPRTIKASLKNTGALGVDVEEIAELEIATEMANIINVRLDFISKTPRRDCVVYTNKGVFFCDLLNKVVRLEYKNLKSPEAQAFDFEYNLPYKSQLNHFLDCIENKTYPQVSLKEAGNVVFLIEAARRSNETGRAEEIFEIV